MHDSSTDFLTSGRLALGANYWASHAGIAMWRNWRPDVIEADFRFLREHGLKVLRVFPLWPDFQPISFLRGGHGSPVEARHGEAHLPDEEMIQSGLSEEMLERFSTMLDLAERQDLDLVVGLITGWMSGRFFVPPALEGLNPITDPVALIWQVRFVQGFIDRFRGHRAIKAWDLGNECNALGKATREQSWLWTYTLASTVRTADSSRPLISGMHSLSVDPDAAWAIRDQGELTDFLTTHPYPLFTPHCHREPLNTMRPILHGTAETCLYSDLGAKPAFVEEFGNLGPMICGPEETAGFAKAALTSIWAHDGRGALWWCAFDQLALDYAPYDWTALERELGLATSDREPKAALREFHAFQQELGRLPFSNLPTRRIDAVCLLTPEQDQWGVGYSAFILAKQAGFDIQYSYVDRTLPASDFYLLPSINSYCSLSRRREDELWNRVNEGASVYLSLDGGLLGRFKEATGVEIRTRSERKHPCEIPLCGGRAVVSGGMHYKFESAGAEVLATDTNGDAVLFCHRLGQGKVYLLGVPLEACLAREPQVFASETPQPHHNIYRRFASELIERRAVRKSNPWIGITEHRMDDGRIIAVLINYSPIPQEDLISTRDDCCPVDQEIELSPRGENLSHISLPPHGHAILELRTKSASSVQTV